MHKGVMLIVKAEDKKEALSKAEEFLGHFGDGNVWDWYVIGGRWTATLNPLTEAWRKKAEKIFNAGKKKKPYVSTEDVKINQGRLQTAWETMGGRGQNPYGRDGYKHGGYPDDVMKLAECRKQVESFSFDYKKKSEESLAQMKEFEDDCMKGYCMKKAGEILSQSFCFDANVYNVEEENYSIPKEDEGVWVVMVDMHN